MAKKIAKPIYSGCILPAAPGRSKHPRNIGGPVGPAFVVSIRQSRQRIYCRFTADEFAGLHLNEVAGSNVLLEVGNLLFVERDR